MNSFQCLLLVTWLLLTGCLPVDRQGDTKTVLHVEGTVSDGLLWHSSTNSWCRPTFPEDRPGDDYEIQPCTSDNETDTWVKCGKGTVQRRKDVSSFDIEDARCYPTVTYCSDTTKPFFKQTVYQYCMCDIRKCTYGDDPIICTKVSKGCPAGQQISPDNGDCVECAWYASKNHSGCGMCVPSRTLFLQGPRTTAEPKNQSTSEQQPTGSDTTPSDRTGMTSEPVPTGQGEKDKTGLGPSVAIYIIITLVVAAVIVAVIVVVVCYFRRNRNNSGPNYAQLAQGSPNITPGMRRANGIGRPVTTDGQLPALLPGHDPNQPGNNPDHPPTNDQPPRNPEHISDQAAQNPDQTDVKHVEHDNVSQAGRDEDNAASADEINPQGRYRDTAGLDIVDTAGLDLVEASALSGQAGQFQSQSEPFPDHTDPKYINTDRMEPLSDDSMYRIGSQNKREKDKHKDSGSYPRLPAAKYSTGSDIVQFELSPLTAGLTTADVESNSCQEGHEKSQDVSSLPGDIDTEISDCPSEQTRPLLYTETSQATTGSNNSYKSLLGTTEQGDMTEIAEVLNQPESDLPTDAKRIATSWTEEKLQSSQPVKQTESKKLATPVTQVSVPMATAPKQLKSGTVCNNLTPSMSEETSVGQIDTPSLHGTEGPNNYGDQDGCCTSQNDLPATNHMNSDDVSVAMPKFPSQVENQHNSASKERNKTCSIMANEPLATTLKNREQKTPGPESRINWTDINRNKPVAAVKPFAGTARPVTSANPQHLQGQASSASVFHDDHISSDSFINIYPQLHGLSPEMPVVPSLNLSSVNGDDTPDNANSLTSSQGPALPMSPSNNAQGDNPRGDNNNVYGSSQQGYRQAGLGNSSHLQVRHRGNYGNYGGQDRPLPHAELPFNQFNDLDREQSVGTDVSSGYHSVHALDTMDKEGRAEVDEEANLLMRPLKDSDETLVKQAAVETTASKAVQCALDDSEDLDASDSHIDNPEDDNERIEPTELADWNEKRPEGLTANKSVQCCLNKKMPEQALSGNLDICDLEAEDLDADDHERPWMRSEQFDEIYFEQQKYKAELDQLAPTMGSRAKLTPCVRERPVVATGIERSVSMETDASAGDVDLKGSLAAFGQEIVEEQGFCVNTDLEGSDAANGVERSETDVLAPERSADAEDATRAVVVEEWERLPLDSEPEGLQGAAQPGRTSTAPVNAEMIADGMKSRRRTVSMETEASGPDEEQVDSLPDESVINTDIVLNTDMNGSASTNTDTNGSASTNGLYK